MPVAAAQSEGAADVKRDEVLSFARQAGADVLGVANIERFDDLPAERHPRTIFPEARSAIVLGRRINRGALRGVEEGTQFDAYAKYGDEWLDNRFVSHLTFRVAEFIEDHGFEAVPLMNLPPEIPPMGVPVRKGQPSPNVIVDVVGAAVRAGVGEIGWCGLFLTTRFGPRQRMQMILTDAAIEPDPVLGGAAVCLRSKGCQGFCPLGALAGGRELVICGKRMTVADVDYARCAKCKNGARPNRWHPSGKPDRLAAACARTCLDKLERAGRIANRFTTPFRNRPAWTIGPDFDLFKA
jgi:epoxyqueuosine reductase QueG